MIAEDTLEAEGKRADSPSPSAKRPVDVLYASDEVVNAVHSRDDQDANAGSAGIAKKRKRERMEAAVRTLLECLGEDPEREGLVDTPARMSKALLDCTAGYLLSPADVIGDAIFNEDRCGDMVIVRDIGVHSLCEHHMLPFYGKAHVAYVPDGKVIGLSKLGRLVGMYARRLQVQERLTEQVRVRARAYTAQAIRPLTPHPLVGRPVQVATALMEHLAPKGVAVIVECAHMCMSMRGVQQPGARTTTRALHGVFQSDATLRSDLLRMLTP